MKLRQLTSIGVAAVLAVTFAAPLVAQSNDDKDYQAATAEKDPKKQVSMLENFISKNPASAHRPEADLKLIVGYINNGNWQLVVKHAKGFALSPPAADNKSKAQVFTLAMEASRQLKSASDVNDFAEKALAADPNNMSVMMTMTNYLLSEAPNDAAGRTAAMDKALVYAERAQKVTKPEATTDAEWNGVQTRLHAYLGLIYFTKNQNEKAAPELAAYLKVAPDDGLAHYRYGLVNYELLKVTLTKLSAMNTEAQAEQKKPDPSDTKMKYYSDELTALSKQFEAERDTTIDALAGALAMGGAFADNANQIFDLLFKQKTNSLDGKTAYIAEKKTQITAAAAAAAPPAAARGASTGFGGGFGGGGGATGGGAGGGRGGR